MGFMTRKFYCTPNKGEGKERTQGWEDRFVNFENNRKGSIGYIHRWKRWQKIVADKETKKNKIVNDIFKIVVKIGDRGF